MGMSGLRHMKENTTHDDLAKERLKMSKKLAPIDELFKKDATLETQKNKFSTVETVQPLTDGNVSSEASAGSLYAAESHGSRACQPSSSSLSNTSLTRKFKQQKFYGQLLTI